MRVHCTIESAGRLKVQFTCGQVRGAKSAATSASLPAFAPFSSRYTESFARLSRQRRSAMRRRMLSLLAATMLPMLAARGWPLLLTLLAFIVSKQRRRAALYAPVAAYLRAVLPPPRRQRRQRRWGRLPRFGSLWHEMQTIWPTFPKDVEDQRYMKNFRMNKESFDRLLSIVIGGWVWLRTTGLARVVSGPGALLCGCGRPWCAVPLCGKA